MFRKRILETAHLAGQVVRSGKILDSMNMPTTRGRTTRGRAFGVRTLRRGAVLVYSICIMLALLALASLAVDFGYVMMVKSELRTALDAASLAGAGGLVVSPTEAKSRAKSTASANKVNGSAMTLQDADLELGTWNATTKSFVVLSGANESKATAMRVTTRLSKARGTQLNLMFARILGRDYVEMQTSSISGFAAGADVVIVQDITTSFSDELADAKVGDKALLDSLYNSGGKGGLGVVVHTGWGKTLAPLQQVSSNYTALTNVINSIKLGGNTGMPKSSGTDPAAGLEEGIKVFDAWTSPSPTGKAMILVSDGEPSSNSAGSHPTLSDSQLLTLAQTTANNAWAKKIHVYVVFFNRDNSTTAANKVKTLIRGNGVFVQVTDPKQLPSALESITKRLPLQLCK